MNIVMHTRKPILQGNTLRGSKQHTDIINILIDLSVSHVPRSINTWVTWHRYTERFFTLSECMEGSKGPLVKEFGSEPQAITVKMRMPVKNITLNVQFL